MTVSDATIRRAWQAEQADAAIKAYKWTDADLKVPSTAGRTVPADDPIALFIMYRDGRYFIATETDVSLSVEHANSISMYKSVDHVRVHEHAYDQAPTYIFANGMLVYSSKES